MEREVIIIRGKPHVCKNPDKDMWVPLEEDPTKTEFSGPNNQIQQNEDRKRVHIPKRPKHGPFGRG